MNVAFISKVSLFLYHQGLMWWVTELYTVLQLRYTVLSWWWRQQIPRKHCYISTRPQGITSQKTPNFRHCHENLHLTWLWKYCVPLTKTGQVQYVPLNTCHKPFNLSYTTVISNTLTNIWILYCRHSKYTTQCVSWYVFCHFAIRLFFNCQEICTLHYKE